MKAIFVNKGQRQIPSFFLLNFVCVVCQKTLRAIDYNKCYGFKNIFFIHTIYKIQSYLLKIRGGKAFAASS